jgi:hypothetical protein
MKLDVTDLRYVTSTEFRVLTAVCPLQSHADQKTPDRLRLVSQVEMGSKNHEVVPSQLIVQISGIRSGNVNQLIGSLARRNLIAKVQNSRCQFLLLFHNLRLLICFDGKMMDTGLHTEGMTILQFARCHGETRYILLGIKLAWARNPVNGALQSTGSNSDGRCDIRYLHCGRS